MIIYEAINTVNNVSYIGQTIQDFETYKKIHIRSALNRYDLKRGKERAFYASIRKYGADVFEWKILCECSSKKELNEMEEYYIEYLDTYKNGYNMTKGGDGGDGGLYERTPEIRERISLSLKGRKMSQEFCDKQRDRMKENHPMLGRNHTEESLTKMSDNSKGDRNASSCRWKITSPDGIVYEFVGGYHDFLKKHGLSRWSMDKVYKGEKEHYKGWRAEKLPS